MKNPFDSNNGNISDEDFVKIIADMVAKEGGLPQEVIPENVALVKAVYEAMKYAAEGTGVKVTYVLHKPYRTCGSVTIIGKNISIISPELFTKCARYASNIEIYTKTNGDTQIDFGFNNLTRTVVTR